MNEEQWLSVLVDAAEEERRNIWLWLRKCRQCNEVHRLRDPGNSLSRTWAHPGDGHPYKARLSPELVDELQSEYERQL